MVWEYFIHFLQIAFPAYIANGSPPFLIKLKKHPLDFGKKWKGERILGEGKTIEGFIFASVMGLVAGYLELLILPFFNYNNFLNIPLIGFFFIGVGAMVGDAIGSFIKRRMKLKRGENAGLLDMLDFIIGSFIFAYFFTQYSVWTFLIALVITPIVHRGANIIGYRIGVKKEPW
jgi:CDP-2,3-bis-(O-geranylgeranyl)-sn-glycerol synthase